VPFCERFFRELLAAGLAETREDLVQRCLTESISFPGDVLMGVLNDPKTTDTRRGAVLRLVRDKHRQLPELEQFCEKILAETGLDGGLQESAIEILARFGRTPQSRRGPGGEQPQPGDVRVDERTGVTLVWIPPGKFRMGSNKGDGDERPVHSVTLTQGFWIGRYVVTNEDYRRFLEDQQIAVEPPKFWDDRKFNQPKQPVVGVNWSEAMKYCEWAGGRLPTEAEWEYACRAGSPSEYCYGDDVTRLADHAWYAANSGMQLQPVGGKKPNDWGLHDMHGNVWEWCFDSMPEYREQNEEDPVGADVESRAIRGGSWNYGARLVRCACRLQGSPRVRVYNLGFRLVRVQDQS
jgi:formylglycine-generating enzyme required for sulfatase activity